MVLAGHGYNTQLGIKVVYESADSVASQIVTCPVMEAIPSLLELSCAPFSR